jgi:pantoate--beta-alanine ligase
VIVLHSIAEMKQYAAAFRREGRSIGFVPTMGALHQGHLSLLESSTGKTDVTVLSVFVNPTQFGPKEDLDRYPRPFEKDCAMAEPMGCGIVFAPAAKEMYPASFRTHVAVDELGEKLCGITRPTHFRGVTTVVLKFLNIVAPDVAFFGQKDAQQAVVIKRMVEDLNVPVRIEICPTIRESDGLAMSSRNAYLTPVERQAAPCIYRGLQSAATLYEQGERDAAAHLRVVEESVNSVAPLLTLEYGEIVDPVTLTTQTTVHTPALLAIACRTAESNTRLIDNIILGGSL